jgi:hypothetical protein
MDAVSVDAVLTDRIQNKIYATWGAWNCASWEA